MPRNVESHIAWGFASGPLEASRLGSSDHACEAVLRLAIAAARSQPAAARIAIRQSQPPARQPIRSSVVSQLDPRLAPLAGFLSSSHIRARVERCPRHAAVDLRIRPVGARGTSEPERHGRT